MKKIRSNFVKESLIDYANLAQTFKENSSSIVKDLLKETVLDTYNQLMLESDDEDDYDVEDDEEDVEDTKSKTETNEAEEAEETEDTEETEEVLTDDVEGEDGDVQGAMPNAMPNAMPDAGQVAEPASNESDEWAQFEKYKVDGSDDEYDFSEAEDEDVVKVYKLLNNDDQVLVNVDKTTNKVELKDNETGAEYLIDLGASDDVVDVNDDMSVEGDLDYENNMNESRIYELVLNEYDSHVGYTDNYQSKDVMTTPSMEEPGKNVNDWDAGVPKSKSKPWAGSTKGKGKPFTEEEVIEDDEMLDECGAMSMEEMDELEEGTNVGGFVQRRSSSKSHIPTNKYPKYGRHISKGSKYHEVLKGETSLEESKTIAKMNKILKENAALKNALVDFKKTLQEAAIVNVNLGQIVKLISENTTTVDEKKEIIARFGKNVKTIQESKELFETISNELKRRQTMNINEDKQFTATPNKMINETQIYKSKAVMNSLDLMSRLCK